MIRVLTAALVAMVMAAVNAASLYKGQTGPFAIEVANPVEIAVADRDQMLRLRISFPVGTGPFPLVVFSHGALCSGDGYARIADHWATHGYVVILPTHLGSRASGAVGSARAVEVLNSQIADMSSILDSLDLIEEQIKPLEGAIDVTRIAVGGHSMGALVASAVSGLVILDPDGSRRDFTDDRYDVAVLLSGPGPLPNVPGDAWETMRLPTLVTTGTNDHANRGGPGATWEWRLGAFELTPAGDKYALVVDGADHFIGGLICEERGEGPPDHEALTIVESASTAFLDAYLKQDANAKAFLTGNAVEAVTGGRAELFSR